MPCAQYGKVWARSNAVSCSTQGMMYALLPPAPSRLSDFDRSIRCCSAQLAAEHYTVVCYSDASPARIFSFNSVSPRSTRWESTFCRRVDKYYWSHGVHILIKTGRFNCLLFRPTQSFKKRVLCYLSKSNPESIFSLFSGNKSGCFNFEIIVKNCRNIGTWERRGSNKMLHISSSATLILR